MTTSPNGEKVMTVINQMKKKFEAFNGKDVVIVKVPFSSRLGDVHDAEKLVKTLHSNRALQGLPFKVQKVSAVVDGDKKEVRFLLDVEGYIDHAKIKNEVLKIFN